MNRPILFSGPMVRAILAGEKTQTRRLVKPQPSSHHWETLPGYQRQISLLECNDGHVHAKFHDLIPQNSEDPVWRKCPYGKPGDRLWVRENFRAELYGGLHGDGESFETIGLEYAAGGDPVEYQFLNGISTEGTPLSVDYQMAYRMATTRHNGFRPSIHMPRWASRLTLEVVAVRVERLQEINRHDAKAEGFLPGMNGLESWGGQCFGNAQLAFEACWKDINSPQSWEDNPYVWVVEFRVLFADEDSQ